MAGISENSDDFTDKSGGHVGKYFDGIKYLWRQPEIRFVLKLIILLLGSMLGYYTTIFLIISFFGETNFLIRSTVYGDPFFFALFFFIMIELGFLFRAEITYKSPEETASSQSPATSLRVINPYRRWVFVVLVAAVIACYLLIFLRETIYYGFVHIVMVMILFSMNFGTGYHFVLFGLLCIIGFVAARGMMNSFNDRYRITFRKNPTYFFVILPISWIFLAITIFFAFIFQFFYYSLGDVSVLDLYSWIFIVYGFLSIISLGAAFSIKSWAGFAVSQLATTIIFVFLILIPFFIDQITILLGGIVSLIVLCFFYLQGTLDEYGDELREFRVRWKMLLRRVTTPSEAEKQAIKSGKIPVPFDFDFQMHNPYRKIALGMMLLLLTFFGIIYVLGPIFPILGPVNGLANIGYFLTLWSFFEYIGIGLSVIIFTIILTFLQNTKPRS